MVLSLSTLSPFLYYAIIAGLSFMSSLFLLWAVCKLWRRFGIMDRPERYGHNRFPVPYAVGVILFLNLLVFSPFLFQNEIHFKRFLIIFIF
jgi:UDP-N-acetylmuramyl pentapeptide phosphotransferase/UDP-N-acetylglucosamine-1-phosphate transferase